MKASFTTEYGSSYETKIEDFLESDAAESLKGKVQMIFTSPPFPLMRKKSYGNKIGQEYLNWIQDLSQPLVDLLTDDGSIVLEIGNAWEKGRPVMSTLPNKSLLAFLEAGDLQLCQQFICHNPARLPSPAQWVNIERIRVKDSSPMSCPDGRFPLLYFPLESNFFIDPL